MASGRFDWAARFKDHGIKSSFKKMFTDEFTLIEASCRQSFGDFVGSSNGK